MKLFGKIFFLIVFNTIYVNSTAQGNFPRVTVEPFGTLNDGRDVQLFTLRNTAGMTVEIIDLGGTIVSLHAADAQGNFTDVTTGFDNPQHYFDGAGSAGAIVGRYANRIANGRFILDGVEYSLAQNNGDNAIHGGLLGFDKKIWEAEFSARGDAAVLELATVSPDGEEGYPGRVEVTVTYTLDHEIKINADRFTPVDNESIPTGEIASVANTPLDFRNAKPIGRDIESSHQQIQFGSGFDHNFVINHEGPGAVSLAASVFSAASGRTMNVYTDQPGMQFYTGNFLRGNLIGKDGRPYERRFAFCLETQHSPDSPNKAGFPSTVLRPGERYETSTIYEFGSRPIDN